MSLIVKDHKFAFYNTEFYFVSLKLSIYCFEFEVYFLVNISLGVLWCTYTEHLMHEISDLMKASIFFSHARLQGNIFSPYCDSI